MAKKNAGAIVQDFDRSNLVPGKFVAAVDLFEGDLVGITATTGLIGYADADVGSLLENAIGVITQDVLAGGVCSIVDRCTVKGLSGFAPGARLFLSATPGTYTETAPATAGHSQQCVGYVVSASVVHVRIQPVLVMGQSSGNSTVAFATTA